MADAGGGGGDGKAKPTASATTASASAATVGGSSGGSAAADAKSATATTAQPARMVLYRLGGTAGGGGVSRYLASIPRVSAVADLINGGTGDGKSSATTTTATTGGGGGARTHLSFIIDKSASMGHAFDQIVIPGCQALQKMAPVDTAVAVYFGQTVDKVDIPAPHVMSPDAFWPLQTKIALEGYTNILEGIRVATENAVTHYHEVGRKQGNWQYIFAFLSDGADNRNTGEALKQGIEACGAKVRQAGGAGVGMGMSTIFLIVGVGAKSDTRIAMRAKTAIETLPNAAQTVYYATTGKQLQDAMIELAADIHKATQRKPWIVALPFDFAKTLKPVTTTSGGDAKEAKGLTASGIGFLSKITDVVGAAAPASAASGSPLGPAGPQRSVALQLTAEQTELGLLVQLPTPPDVADEEQAAERTLTHVLVNGVRVPVVYSSAPPPAAAVLERIQSAAQDIRVASVAGHDTSTAVGVLDSIVAHIKQSYAAGGQSMTQLMKLTPDARVAAMRIKTVIVGLETELNALKDAIATARTMSSDASASWLQATSKMKFGAKALRLAQEVDVAEVVADLRRLQQRLNDPETAAALTAATQLEETLATGRGVSFMSTMTGTQHLLQLRDHSLDALLDDPSVTLPQLLYAFGVTGVCIDVARSEAANIQPWAVGVNYVSCDYVDIPAATCGLDSAWTLKDVSARRAAADVLVLLDPQNPLPYQLFRATRLHDVYTSLMVTRNTNLFQPQQHTALLMAALVRAITQLAQSVQYRTYKHIETVFVILYTLRHVMLKSAAKAAAAAAGPSVPGGAPAAPATGAGGYWHELVGKLFAPNPARFMTEAEGDDIQSVHKLLGALCVFSDEVSPLFTDPTHAAQLSRVAQALMAEAVSRTARIYRRTTLAATQPATKALELVVGDAMGVKADSVPHPTMDDVAKAKADADAAKPDVKTNAGSAGSAAPGGITMTTTSSSGSGSAGSAAVAAVAVWKKPANPFSTEFDAKQTYATAAQILHHKLAPTSVTAVSAVLLFVHTLHTRILSGEFAPKAGGAGGGGGLKAVFGVLEDTKTAATSATLQAQAAAAAQAGKPIPAAAAAAVAAASAAGGAASASLSSDKKKDELLYKPIQQAFAAAFGDGVEAAGGGGGGGDDDAKVDVASLDTVDLRWFTKTFCTAPKPAAAAVAVSAEADAKAKAAAELNPVPKAAADATAAAAAEMGKGFGELKTPNDVQHYKQALALQGLLYHTSGARKPDTPEAAPAVMALAREPAQVLGAMAADARLALWESRMGDLKRAEAEKRAAEVAAMAAKSRRDRLDAVVRMQFNDAGQPNFFRLWPLWVRGR